MHLGGKFWLKLAAAVILCAIATVIVFIVVGVVWYAWGFLGALIVIACVFGGMGWVHDKRERRREAEVPAA